MGRPKSRAQTFEGLWTRKSTVPTQRLRGKTNGENYERQIFRQLKFVIITTVQLWTLHDLVKSFLSTNLTRVDDHLFLLSERISTHKIPR